MLKDPITMKVPRLAHAIIRVIQARHNDDLPLGESLIQYMLDNDPDVVRLAEKALDLQLSDFNPYKQVVDDEPHTAAPVSDDRSKRNSKRGS